MTRKPFPDPYEGMSDDALDRHFADLIAANRQRQRAVSIRFPEELQGALKELAAELGIGYQVLIKTLLERDVERLRQRKATSRRPGTGRAATRPRAAPPRRRAGKA